jgi:hypothetical protein
VEPEIDKFEFQPSPIKIKHQDLSIVERIQQKIDSLGPINKKAKSD